MILCFTLSMPSNNSWNGRWSGESNLYCRVINFGRSKKSNQDAQRILDVGSYSYHFGDGWVACISVSQVDSRDAQRLRKRSKGFCGYDWMISSIRYNNEIKIGD